MIGGCLTTGLPNSSGRTGRWQQITTYPGVHPGERQPGGERGGRRRRGHRAGRLQAFLAAYNPTYDWDAAATDDMKQRMREINVIVPLQSPAEMSKYLVDDIARNADVIKAANVKLE